MQVIKDEKGKLPYGVYSKKHNRINNLLFIPLLVFALIIFLFVKQFLDRVGLLMLIAMFALIVGFCIMFVIVQKFNPYVKLRKNFIKTLDIDRCIHEVNLLINNNQLHSESVIELQLFLVDSLMYVDYIRAYDLFEQIKPATIDYLQMSYEIRKFLFAYNNGKPEEAKKIYDDFLLRFNKPSHKFVRLNFEYMYKVNLTDDIIEDAEAKFLINTKNKYTNITNMHGLMRYFISRNDIKKAKTYANMILDMKTCFNEINDDAKEVLEESDS